MLMDLVLAVAVRRVSLEAVCQVAVPVVEAVPDRRQSRSRRNSTTACMS